MRQLYRMNGGGASGMESRMTAEQAQECNEYFRQNGDSWRWVLRQKPKRKEGELSTWTRLGVLYLFGAFIWSAFFGDGKLALLIGIYAVGWYLFSLLHGIQKKQQDILDALKKEDSQ